MYITFSYLVRVTLSLILTHLSALLVRDPHLVLDLDLRVAEVPVMVAASGVSAADLFLLSSAAKPDT